MCVYEGLKQFQPFTLLCNDEVLGLLDYPGRSEIVKRRQEIHLNLDKDDVLWENRWSELYFGSTVYFTFYFLVLIDVWRNEQKT